MIRGHDAAIGEGRMNDQSSKCFKSGCSKPATHHLDLALRFWCADEVRRPGAASISQIPALLSCEEHANDVNLEGVLTNEQLAAMSSVCRSRGQPPPRLTDVEIVRRALMSSKPIDRGPSGDRAMHVALADAPRNMLDLTRRNRLLHAPLTGKPTKTAR